MLRAAQIPRGVVVTAIERREVIPPNVDKRHPIRSPTDGPGLVGRSEPSQTARIVPAVTLPLNARILEVLRRPAVPDQRQPQPR
jgi:hypothetical protein